MGILAGRRPGDPLRIVRTRGSHDRRSDVHHRPGEHRNSFNWYYVLITAFFVAFSLFLGFSRFGDIKLGHDDDEPEFSLLAWFALLFAAGMGIGLVFYGVSEPLSHFATPRPGVTGSLPELAQQALSQTYLHWGVHAWSIYVVIGLALAYAIHRRKRPVSIRWALEPLLGKRVQGSWGNAIDVVALVGTLFGVATSLGLGVLQISAGLESINLVQASRGSEIVIILMISLFVLLSVLSGVTKGMKWLSSINLVLAGLLVVYLLVFGPSTFLLREFVQSMGAYIQNFVSLSFNVNAFTGEEGAAVAGLLDIVLLGVVDLLGARLWASSSRGFPAGGPSGSSSPESSWCPP